MNFDSTNTFCIHCREIPDRSDFAREHFHRAGLDVTMFEGIHGTTFGLSTSHVCNLDGKNDNWRISPGHVGLILSHYMVWSHIAASRLDAAIVLEDDAHIDSQFKERLGAVMRDLEAFPTWDIVYLGWLDNHPRTKIDKGQMICRIDGVPFGTHAMLISSRGARKLLDTNRICWAHIDTQIYHRTLKQPDCQWFVTKRSICSQRSQQQIEGTKWNPST